MAGLLILKDGTEFELDSINYVDKIGDATDDVFLIKIYAGPEPKTMIESIKSTFSVENIANITTKFVDETTKDEVVMAYTFAELRKISFNYRVNTGTPYVVLELV